MHVGIHHSIKDAQKWEQNTQNLMSKVNTGTLPAGMKPVLFIPATNQKTAVCVWEGPSVDSVRKFVDNETGQAARNEYFEVDTRNAVGLGEVAVAKK